MTVTQRILVILIALLSTVLTRFLPLARFPAGNDIVGVDDLSNSGVSIDNAAGFMDILDVMGEAHGRAVNARPEVRAAGTPPPARSAAVPHTA